MSGLAQENHIYKINTAELRKKLENVGIEQDVNKQRVRVGANDIKINLPDPSGKLLSFSVVESPIMSKELRAEFPEIKTYKLFSDSELVGALTTSPEMIYSTINSQGKNIFITPADKGNDEYFVGYEQASFSQDPMERVDRPAENIEKQLRTSAVEGSSHDSFFRTYRLAIITTGEFYQKYGNKDAQVMTALNSIISSVNLVYENELSIKFELTAAKLYKNPSSDPFDETAGMIADQAAIAFYDHSLSDPGSFGIGKYDLGHVFHYSTTILGGSTYPRGTCDNSWDNYFGPNYDDVGYYKGASFLRLTTNTILPLIQAIGFQFNAIMMFNSNKGQCSDQAPEWQGFEPGGGSTFMTYHSTCVEDNIAIGETPSYFNATSLMHISSYVKTHYWGSTCGTKVATGNTPPIVNVNPNGSSLKIPKGTPFTLTGSASDPNGDPITYNWEQTDYDPDKNFRGTAIDAQNSTKSPIFRSFPPSANGNVRTFPKLSTVLSGAVANKEEALPQISRQLKMRFSARDKNSGGNGYSEEMLTLDVVNAGPFLITSQNSSTNWTGNGANKATIKWSVNNTNKAPLNISKVRILLSTDGGNSFPIVLADNINNNGTYEIVIPSVNTTKGRIKIEPMGNHLFFDINNANIKIESNCPSNLTLSGNAASGVQLASNKISSTQVIKSGRDVTYSAGKSIELNPKNGSGFEVSEGAVFKTEIGGCL